MTHPQVIPPSVLWAQRNDTLFVTVSLTDIKNERFTLDEHKFTFRGVGGPDEKQYACEIQFLKEVVPQESKHKKTDRGLFFVIKKKESGPYWSSLVTDKKKPHFIHTDFGRWKDEDESSDEDNPYDDTSMSTLMQQMGGLGGGAGTPNLDDLNAESSDDSDDEPLPGLEDST